MEGRFPKPVTPGYADDSPLSFPIRQYIDWPAVSATFESGRSNPINRRTVPQADDVIRASRVRPRVSPSGATVSRRRANTENFLFYGYPSELIARWCGVSVQTAVLYKTGSRKPSRQALRLFVLHRDGRVLGSEWKEWTVRKDKLVNPEGEEYTQGQLRAYILVMQLARELAKVDPKAKERYYEILRSA